MSRQENNKTGKKKKKQIKTKEKGHGEFGLLLLRGLAIVAKDILNWTQMTQIYTDKKIFLKIRVDPYFLCHLRPILFFKL
jgi:hypothetical protein